MKNLSSLLILALLLCACNEANNTSRITDSKPDTVKSVGQLTRADSTLHKIQSKVLLVNKLGHYFSSKERKDTFSLTMVGDSIITATIYFAITDYNNHVIYADTFPANVLMEYIIDTAKTLKEHEDTIKNAFKAFFAEDRFHCPAIDDSDEGGLVNGGDKEMRKNWKEIKSYKDAVGYYIWYAEGYSAIAYSKKKKRAVFYDGED